LTDSGEPECYDKALYVEAKDKWEFTTNDEMESLMKNQTWDLVELLEDKKALHNKWVYWLKENDDTKRDKARLVVKGFQQRECINFTEIFSLVVKLTTTRSVLSILTIEDLHLKQLNVKTVILHGDFKKVIYMMQPQGYIMLDKEHLVYKLKKSLYGLK